MIVPMKKVTVVVQTSEKLDMLRRLRKLGVMHIYDEKGKSTKGEELEKEHASLQLVQKALQENLAADKNATAGKQVKLTEEAFQSIHKELVSQLDLKKELVEQIGKDTQLVEQVGAWGEFDPSQIRKLADEGVSLFFYTLSKQEFEKLGSDVDYLLLDPVNKQRAIATVGKPLDLSAYPATRFELPELGPSALRQRIADSRKKVADVDSFLRDSCKYLDAYALTIRVNEMDQKFEQVASQMGGGENLCYVTGYIPQTAVVAFQKAAKKNAWGYLMDDPEDDDIPPTYVKYARGVGIIKPLFDILGTVPAYREGEISTWFLMFFTLFFAMIIGDAGYGMIFLAVTILLHVKQHKATDAVKLLYVLSIATVVWGSLTGTWFGSESIVKYTPLKYLVFAPLASYPALFGVDAKVAQNNLMHFCFILGTIQLSLAEVINISRKLAKKEISFLADVGWLMDILVLYFVVLSLVIQAPCNYRFSFSVIGVGFLLVVFFGSQQKGQSFGIGILHGLAGFFTTFLDTISCFSNLMSYIRLFAVGLATLAIAQSFNAMAAPLIGGWATVAGLLVLALGHGLNLMMGLLSVFVHGVRLNLLEFSGQLGMEWSGIAYEPFRETVILK